MRTIPCLMVLACGPQLDVGGCPTEGLDAVGARCGEEGRQCYEFSLCDPCATDMSACEALVCEDGAWAELDLPTECTTAG